MLQNYNIDISDFIKITNTGVITADFTQVRETLIRKYKDVYGNDIDLSTGTADGVFVNNLSLVINNILQTVKDLYSNLDINSATGIYLDNLCALSNITRKPATYSTANVLVTNTNDSPLNINSLTCVDKSGIEWVYNKPLSFAASGENGSVQAITLTCNDIGPIEAPEGWIYQTIDLSYLTIEQNEKAIVGQSEESDESLRARRSQSNGGNGLTVLESLMGALLQISGIKDVKIFNNQSGEDDSILSHDGTTVKAHSIYIILRYEENVNVSDEVIGKTIYEKLTPGILTNQSSGNNGESKQFVYTPNILGQALTQFNNNIYWKKATAYSAPIYINIRTLNYFDENKLPEFANNIISYLNNLSIRNTLSSNDIFSECLKYIPSFLGQPIFNLYSVNFSSTLSTTPESISYNTTYLKYSNFEIIQSLTDTTLYTITLT